MKSVIGRRAKDYFAGSCKNLSPALRAEALERLLGYRLLDVAQYDRLAKTPSSAD
jgi:hypothetical protein